MTLVGLTWNDDPYPLLGGPLNKFTPDLPGIIESSDLDNTIISVMKGAVVPGAQNNIGQKRVARVDSLIIIVLNATQPISLLV